MKIDRRVTEILKQKSARDLCLYLSSRSRQRGHSNTLPHLIYFLEYGNQKINDIARSVIFRCLNRLSDPWRFTPIEISVKKFWGPIYTFPIEFRRVRALPMSTKKFPSFQLRLPLSALHDVYASPTFRVFAAKSVWTPPHFNFATFRQRVCWGLSRRVRVPIYIRKIKIFKISNKSFWLFCKTWVEFDGTYRPPNACEFRADFCDSGMRKNPPFCKQYFIFAGNNGVREIRKFQYFEKRDLCLDRPNS